MKGTLIVCGLVALMASVSVAQAEPLPQGTATPIPTVVPTTGPTPVATTATPRRLPTGTIVKIDSSWATGADNVLIVNNGQALDAVVTLTRGTVPMMSVYVRAHESFTSIPIWHDTYTLSFVLGQDWDSTALTFTGQVQSDRFDQPLVFERNVIPTSDWSVAGISYTYWKAYLGSGKPNDPKTLEELGDTYPVEPEGSDREED